MDVGRFQDAGMEIGRAPAVAATAMVATPSGWGSSVGLEALRAGGSAVDAAIAVGAALVVAQPHQCGLGGDAFWLIRSAEGTTSALNASGRAPAAADPSELLAAGLDVIPPRSGWAVTVPGVVSGWAAAHERHGRLPLERLLAPAAEAADRGLATSPLLARQLRMSAPVLRARPESARLFTSLGSPPGPGTVLRQPDLAATLRRLASDPGSMYRGELAERVAVAACDSGGWMQPGDLEAHRCDWTKPVRTPFAGWTVEEMPPNSQGLAALVGMRLLQAGGLPAPHDDGEWAHRSVEAAKVLMAVRDAEIADPAAMRCAPEALLEDDYLAPLQDLLRQAGPLRRTAIEQRVGPAPVPVPQAPRGDTVHFAVVDGDGLAVSCIQSVFEDFGSGIVVPGTGILLHNRGAGFSLQEDHIGVLAPGRRPPHTLAPGMATAGGRTAAVFGSMGGHAQAQLHLQLVGAMAGRGVDPATAVAAPRWFVSPEDEDVVRAEDRGALAAGLEDRGHRVQRVEPFAQQMGHAQVILVDEATGALFAAADPRSDGVALGY